MPKDSILNGYIEMGSAASQNGDHELADRMFNAALVEAERGQSNNVRLAGALQNIALLCVEQKRYLKAETFFRRALVIYEHSLSRINPHSPDVLDGLAYLSFVQEKYGQAAQYYKRAMKIDEKLGVQNCERMSMRWKKLAWLYTSKNQFEQAYSALANAKELSKKLIDNNDSSGFSKPDFLVENGWL
jgi:tetratricopeptide (TPR) repeat protein